MEPTPSPVLYVFILAAFCGGLWAFICLLASRGSGWHRMAQRFGNSSPLGMGGERARFASARIGWANYSGALDLRASPSGLHLATIPFFRPFHPPLLIPWGEVEVQPTQRPGATPWLSFRSVPGVRIRFSKRAFALLQRYLEDTTTETGGHEGIASVSSPW